MESMNLEAGHVESGKREMVDLQIVQLSELQLALVGGGSGDVTLS
jgi:hypothetical protein